LVATSASDATPHLGVVNCLSGTGIYPLGRFAVADFTSIDVGADSAHVLYSDAALSARPFSVLGYFEWSSGLTTAGIWDTAPDIVEPLGPHTPLPGQEIQSQRSASGAVDTGATSAIFDNTIPQSGEGKIFLSRAITPTSKANVLRIDGQSHLSPHSGTNGVSALFRDSGADALASTETYFGATADLVFAHKLNFEERAPSTAAITYKLLCATGTGTYTFNGINGSASLGGTLNSYLNVREIMA
jgi:hypothetical protein